MIRKLTLALLLAFGSPVAARVTASAGCDERCQTGMMDRLIAAMAAHDPRAAPLAADIRYTENGQEVAIGDGFWGTASAGGGYRHYFTDPATGQVGLFGTLRENGDPVLAAFRLKIAGGRIHEIEAVLARTERTGPLGQGPAMLDQLGHPNPIWDQPIPEAERMSRDDLVAAANMYFTGLQENDGRGVYPFADDCYRLENGFQTTGPSPISLSNPPPPRPGEPSVVPGPVPNWAQLGCKAQFELGWMRFVDRIRERRFAVVDPAHGTVLAFTFFDHSGTLHDFELANGDRIVGTGLQEPYTWEIAEAFRIERGKIRLIEAVLTHAPYGMGSNWPVQPPFPVGPTGAGR